MDQNLIFFILLVSDNMGVVKGRSKIIIAHIICHAQNVYNYLENVVSSELNTKECQFQSYLFVRSKCATRTLPKS